MGVGTFNAGLTSGVFTGGPGATNSMIPLTKFHAGPELPPWKDPYNTTQRNTIATPNTYSLEHSDPYTIMNPVGSAFPPNVPPPQYEASSSLTTKGFDHDQLYSEIPGDYSTFQGAQRNDHPQPQYGNIPTKNIKLQLNHGDTEKEDLSTKSDISTQEVCDD